MQLNGEAKLSTIPGVKIMNAVCRITFMLQPIFVTIGNLFALFRILLLLLLLQRLIIIII